MSRVYRPTYTQLQSILGGGYVGDDESPNTLPHQFIHLSAGSRWRTRDDQGSPEQHRTTLLTRHKILLHQKLRTWSELFLKLGVFSIFVLLCMQRYLSTSIYLFCVHNFVKGMHRFTTYFCKNETFFNVRVCRTHESMLVSLLSGKKVDSVHGKWITLTFLRCTAKMNPS